MEDKIRRLAIINAVEHDGRAEMNSVLGRLIAEDPSIKSKIKTLMPEIEKIVEEVNSMGRTDQEYMIEKLKITIRKEKKEERHELPELPNSKMRKVVTAFPPEPGKYPHLGHAKSALINFAYAKKYKGRFVLRFEESNPEVAKKEYYKAVMDGLKWLGIKWDEIDYLSDHLPEYYKAIEKLVKTGNAYVCVCSQEKIKENRASGSECPCRSRPEKANLELWQRMLKDAKEGEAIVRMKIDMKSENTVMRDPSIARINEKPHPRTGKKYRVWPTYDLGTSMLDAWEKVTHRFRTKEFELRKDLQVYILKKLGFKPPEIMEIGRFQIKDAIIQGREIRDGIERKIFSGWDDPRLATLVAIKRRGFEPEAIKEFLMSTGATKTESVYEWQVIEAFNRKHIDPVSDRYFGVLDPVKVKIDGLPKDDLDVQTRPGSKKTRKIPVKSESVFIDKEDERELRDKKAGLMFLCTANFGEVKRFVSRSVSQDTPKIHWVGEDNVKIRIFMPDGTVAEGVGEPSLKNLKVDQTIQFYRVGFCRVDKIGKEVTFYFAHK